MPINHDIAQVKNFWESHPLWTSESRYPTGSMEFFEEHRHVCINDCLEGTLDPRILPPPENSANILDLGCGPGFWTIELAQRGCTDITAADLTGKALQLAEERCKLYNVSAIFSQQNAESMTFANGTFNHVNCQGVIHHTPDTASCVREIARVLKSSGTASISVYYRNVFLRNWHLLAWLGKFLFYLGAKLRGRGRESIFSETNTEEIVRLYDGAENPIGKSYSKKEFSALLEPYFHIDEFFLHFFPARTLPFRLPTHIHTMLARHAGFMLYSRLRKK